MFKKEGDVTKGKPYWEIAREFIEEINQNEEILFVSTITLKELYFRLGDKFPIAKQFFKETECIKVIKTSPEDYQLAREFEQKHPGLSFYDYLHLAIAIRLKLVFITRDKELIEFAKSYVPVYRPEELIR